MSKLGYKVTSVLVCDQVRREDNGKEIIIGVYRDSIIVPRIPTVIPMLTFRITAQVDHTEFKNMKFSVIGPSRHKLLDYEGETSVDNSHEPLIVVFSALTPELQKAGLYTIKFGLDSQLRKVGHFNVRLPANEGEMERVGTQ